MSESDALRKLAIYLPKVASIWVLFWSWFNSKLKSRSKAVRDANLFRSDNGVHEVILKDELDRFFRQSGPKVFTGTGKSKQANRTRIGWPMFKFTRKLLFEQDVFEVRPAGEFGNGVFARRTVTFQEVRNALVGKEGEKKGGGGVGFWGFCL